MSDVRTWTLAEIDRRVAAAQAATAGPWRIAGYAGTDSIVADGEPPADDGDGTVMVADIYEEDDLHYLVGLSPDRMVALYEWMRGEVGKHKRQGCPECSFTYDGCECGDEWSDDGCPFLAGLASALGYPGSGEGEDIVCRDYPNCDREHAGGAGGVPVHPPVGSRISGDEALIPAAPPAAPVQSGGRP